MDGKYHIVFAGDDNYIKFTAVTITSIVENTDTAKSVNDFKQINKELHGDDFAYEVEKTSEEGYVFHILTDGVSSDTEVKLNLLAQELNDIFPTEIKIHTFTSKEFHGFPTWRKSYLPYFRLKISKILDATVEKVLYLDSDIVVNCDLREIFAINLNHYTAAVVNEYERTKQFKAFNGGETYNFNGKYFNSGVILLNMKKWLSEDIETKALDFLKKYSTTAPDQDALNVVIKDLLWLPSAWNLNNDLSYSYFESEETSKLSFFDESWTKHFKANKKIKIIHYFFKPWSSKGIFFTGKAFIYTMAPSMIYWWDLASEVPAFKEDLLTIKESKKYIKNTEKENKIIKMIEKNGLQFYLYLNILKLNRSFKPIIKAIETPFKRIRNKLREKFKK